MASTTTEPAVRARPGRPDNPSLPGKAPLRAAPARPARGLISKPARVQLATKKLRVPVSAVPVLSRPRLTALLSEATRRRVTLICGPAGSGKTVACAHWAEAQPAGQPVAWLSLDPADRDPGRLWAHLREAIAGAPAPPAATAAEVRAIGAAGAGIRAIGAAGAGEFPLRLAETAERFDPPVTVVLDDIHLLAGSSALPGLDFLIRHSPPSFRLLLAGRHPGGLPLARLRVSGDLSELGAADLACTRGEADEYLALAGMELAPEPRDDLMAVTQGWITGLRLAVLAAGAYAAWPGQARTLPLSGTDPAVSDYLWDEMLAPLPPDRRLFLYRVAITSQTCGPLADAMTGTGGSAKLLEDLCRENLLIELVPGAAPADRASGGP